MGAGWRLRVGVLGYVWVLRAGEVWRRLHGLTARVIETVFFRRHASDLLSSSSDVFLLLLLLLLLVGKKIPPVVRDDADFHSQKPILKMSSS